PTELDRARAIQNYFLNAARFRYSTSSDVPQITTPDALERFLRGGRGFCEQYSSAMAAMLRYLGIPSRVAVGFTPGRRLANGTFVVTTREAHAWPEVWFAGAGWVRFEPTPRAGVTTVPSYAQTNSAGGGPQVQPAPVTPADKAAQASNTRTTGKDLDRALREGRAPVAPSLAGRSHGVGPVSLW
ncbi:MAG: transglutaminase-like domain-containing protein, partial [Actinomycetota bacterium]|nr:transglutaminase-like domain-containing protein [Actinomycetota bacterium]